MNYIVTLLIPDDDPDHERTSDTIRRGIINDLETIGWLVADSSVKETTAYELPQTNPSSTTPTS